MTKKECIAYFGSLAKISRQLKITKAAVTNWGEYPPKLRQYEMSNISNEILKVEKY